MALQCLGVGVHVEEVEAALSPSRDGCTTAELVGAAASWNAVGKIQQVEAGGLAALARGSILHFRRGHYVVLDFADAESVRVFDPAQGVQTLAMRLVPSIYSGVAITFDLPVAPRRRPLWIRDLIRRRSWFAPDRRTIQHVVAVSVVSQALALATPLLVGRLIDRAGAAGHASLWFVVACFAGMLVVQWLLSVRRQRVLARWRAQADRRLGKFVFGHLLSLPPLFFGYRQIGDLIARLGSPFVVREIVSGFMFVTLFECLVGIAGLCLLVWFSPLIAVVTVGAIGLQVLLVVSTERRRTELFNEEILAQTQKAAFQIQALHHIQAIKADGDEDWATEQLAEREAALADVAFRKRLYLARVDAHMSALRTGAPLLVLFLTSISVSEGGLSVGGLVSVAGIAAAVLGTFNSLAAFGVQLHNAHGHFLRSLSLLTAPTERRSTQHASFGWSGGVALENVWFRYSASAPFALRDVSLQIAGGSMVGIVGRSGSGKSTLAALLLGLFPPTRGSVLVDAYDLQKLDPVEYRRRWGCVLQGATLIEGSIHDNIVRGDRTASREDVRRAARLAQLDDEVMRLPSGYDTVVGEAGVGLSGGQRQRVALARLFLKQPQALLLDEATNAVDIESEARILKAIRAMTCTTVIVAQRWSAVSQCSVVYVVEDGRIVECGRPSEMRTLDKRALAT